MCHATPSFSGIELNILGFAKSAKFLDAKKGLMSDFLDLINFEKFS